MKITLPLIAVISAYSATITARPQAADAAVNVVLNVYGGGGIIFSGTVHTDGRNVTTRQGGTHRCDGTNGGAHPTPGATPTTALADAADKAGFTFDGQVRLCCSMPTIRKLRPVIFPRRWYDFPSFEDFAIKDIKGVNCTWRYTINGYFPPGVGGCQAQVHEGDTVVWWCAH